MIDNYKIDNTKVFIYDTLQELKEVAAKRNISLNSI